LLTIHPILASLLVPFIFTVAALGWRYRLTRAPGSGDTHQRWGKRLLAALALVWILGLIGVLVANLPSAPPANSGHFFSGTLLLVGYGVSAALMLRFGKNIWIRRLHVTANTLLLFVVVTQVLAGINRLYKFELWSPVPQDQSTRSLLSIKFGLTSPPATAVRDQNFSWTAPSDGQSFGGNWKLDSNSILQSDCGCSGNLIGDTLTINNRFPLLIFNNPVLGDGDYSAEFKIEAGQVDQYAGLAFRIVNPQNYYVVRASASEQNVTLARFDNGSRTVVRSFPAKVQRGEWQAVRVNLRGAEVTIRLNDQTIGAVTDDVWLTGRLGLGTKADSVTRFRNIIAIGK